ncbi:MAG: hypothetical protein WCP85_15005 [Mariniphaga sp.]
MKNIQILKILAEKDFPAFLAEWKAIKEQLTQKEKQDLIVQILDDQYSDDYFGFYVKVFDKIIEGKVSLDFNIDHWATTLLSLTVHLVSRQLFDYFLRKGASLNFIGDTYAFESEESIQREVGSSLSMRYETCLDFAENKLADALTTDYNYHVPEKEKDITHWADVGSKEEITINKQDYYYLLEQAKYLRDLIHTDRLVDHIKTLGGKTYRQLAQTK